MRKVIISTLGIVLAFQFKANAQFSLNTYYMDYKKGSDIQSKKDAKAPAAKGSKRKSIADMPDTEPDNTVHGAIFGSGTAAGLEQLTSVNANFAIGGLLKYKDVSLLFGYNSHAAGSVDSANIVKTFLFPEINARAFVIGLYYNINHTTNPFIFTDVFINASTGYVKDTSGHTIAPYNLNLGFRFSIHANLAGDSDSNVSSLGHLSFTFQPYYSLITIDPKDFANYNSIFNNDKGYLQPTIHALGSKFTFEVGHIQIFFDGKYILNSPTSNSVFNNTYWTIGTNVNTNIFTFPSKKAAATAAAHAPATIPAIEP